MFLRTNSDDYTESTVHSDHTPNEHCVYKAIQYHSRHKNYAYLSTHYSALAKKPKPGMTNNKADNHPAIVAKTILPNPTAIP